MDNSASDPTVKLPFYSLKDFPGVLDDEIRLIDFLKLYYYNDLFSRFEGYDMAIRDWSWVRFNDYRMLVVYCCCDTNHIDPGEPILVVVDPWVVLGDYIVHIPYDLLPPAAHQLVYMVACRFCDRKD